MLKLTLALVILLIAQGFNSQCSLGCLACRKTSPITFQCSVCDLHNNFALDEHMRCVKREIPDCEIPSADHMKKMCLMCKEGFVYDKDQEKCVQVTEFHKVDNCRYYLGLNHCQECRLGFDIKDGLCVSLGDKEISGCVTYNTDQTQCLACEAGKFVNENKCEVIEKVQNCSIYSEIICDECGSGFTYEKNFYSTSDMSVDMAHEIITNQKMNVDRVLPPLSSVCIKQDIPNCLTYVNFSFCGKCKDGFYLDSERNCTPNPINEIPHCVTYSNSVTCVECDIEHFLSSNECQKREMQDNCVKYEVNSSTCVECSGLFFLNPSMNKCEERIFSKQIEYCVKRAVKSDECETCKDRFMLTSDNRKCLFHVSNCSKYEEPTNYVTEHLKCENCNEGFFSNPDASECLPQDIINCHTYESNSQHCKECNNGFFYDKDAMSCEPRFAMNCLTEPEDEDKCLTCVEGHFLEEPNCMKYTITNCEELDPTSDNCIKCREFYFRSEGRCFKHNIVGCKKFSSFANLCEECSSGYFKKNDLCFKHNLPNCTKASDSSNECEDCESGFFKNEEKKCQEIYVPNCKTHSESVNECAVEGCEEGFWRNDDGQCFVITQAFCAEADVSNGECKTCEEGYVQIGGDGSLPCVRQYKPFCEEYDTDSLNCSRCRDNYYVSNGSCFLQDWPGCKVFVDGNSEDCQECREGFYKKDDRCYAYTISNCAVAETDNDKCSQCISGFVLQDQGLTCIKNNLMNCKDPHPTEMNKCQTCADGFGLNVENQCEEFKLEENCLVAGDLRTGIDSLTVSSNPSVTSPPFYQCEICALGYYPGDAATGGCRTNNQPNCAEKTFNENKCTICNSRYYPNASGVCTQIASFSDCFYSNGVDDNCSVCLPGFYFSDPDGDGVDSCVANSDTSVYYDDLCKANETKTDGGCSWCEEGYINYSSTSPKIVTFFDGCVSGGPGNCLQCEEGYKLQTTPTNKCVKHTGSIMTCLQKEANSVEALDTATNCAKCADYESFYLDDGNSTCTERDLPSIDNCMSLSKTSDQCDTCKEGTSYFGDTQYYGVCVDENRYGKNPRVRLDSASDPFCLLYDFEALSTGLKCLVCKKGYKPDASGKCEYFDGVNFAFDVTNSYFKTEEVPTGFANGSVPGFSKNVWTYMKCNDGYLAVLESNYTLTNTRITLNQTEHTDIHTAYDKQNSKFMPWVNGAEIHECKKVSEITSKYYTYLDRETTPTIGPVDPHFENCLLSVKDDSDNYFCLKCKENFLPRIMLIKNVSASGSTELFFSAVACWERTDEFEKKYVGIEPPYLTSVGLSVDDILNFDSCANGKILVAFLRYFGSQRFYWDSRLPTGGSVPLQPNMPGVKCFDTIHKDAYIEGCHLYAIQFERDPVTHHSAKCLGCKPGYKATVTSNRTITQCVPIENCDTSDPSKNTWMNSCETCTGDSAWVYDEPNKIFRVDTCVQPTSTSISNCQIVDHNDKCLVCRKGYEMINQSICVKIIPNANGCTKFGHGANVWTLKSLNSNSFSTSGWNVSTTAKVANNFALLNYLYNDDSDDSTGFGCMECANGIPPVGLKHDASETIDVCLENPQAKAFLSDFKGECLGLLFSKSNPVNPCGLSVPGKVIDLDDSILADDLDGSLAHCRKMGGGTCVECREGARLNSSNNCVPTKNCQQWDSSDNCVACEKGYMPDFSDSTKTSCVEASTTDPCDKWTFDMGCIRCRNNNTPITIFKEDGSVVAKCSNVSHVQSNGTPHSHAGLPFKIYYDSGATTWKMNDEFWANNSDLGMTVETSGSSTPTSYCVPSFTIPNCSILGRSNECFECEQGYFRSGRFECQKGSLEGCIQYGPYGEKCVLCGAAYYNDAGECKRREISTNCLKASLDADRCSECTADHYIQNAQCNPYDIDHCKTHHAFNNYCLECVPGYVLNSNSKCVSVEDPLCAAFYTQSSECLRCMDGFFLNSDGKCQKYSTPGCRVYRQNQDQCIQCEPEYYLTYNDNGTSNDVNDDLAKCTERFNLNCLKASPTADECLSCQEGYFLSGNSCERYTVGNCSLAMPGSDKCVDCLDGYFLNSDDNCVMKSDPLCKIMGRYNSRCLLCSQGTHYDASSNKCKLNTKSCAIFNPNADECLSCDEGFWNDVGTCKRYTARNCKIFMPTEDRCSICVDNHYLEDDGNCLISKDPNCMVLQTYSDACVKCHSGHFLNDKKVCQAYSVKNCEYFDLLDDACLFCKEGFFLNDDLNCEKVTQKNCLGVVGNMNQCASCEMNHYYSDGACLAYTVENCSQKDPDADNCKICQKGYYKDVNSCKEYTVEHCKTFMPNLDECSACEKEYYLYLGKCLKYTLEHCIEPYPEADMCIECERDEYFRNGFGKCQKASKVENCAKYHQHLDKCVECKEGSYFQDGQCPSNPSGVYMCKDYSTDKLCSVCEAPYYLKENQCVRSERIIPNCIEYNFESNCAMCKNKYFLDTNECIPATNNTCLEYSSPENCSKCGENEVLNTGGSNFICEASGIEFCLEAEYSTQASEGNQSDVTNICRKCQPGYYLENNSCTSTSSVAQCSEYASDTLCSKCNANHLLSKDQKRCSPIDSQAGANCSVGRQTSSPECIVCQEGYFFNKEGECVECQVEGCAICDVVNLRKCKLCKSGYQMNELFYCLRKDSFKTSKSNRDVEISVMQEFNKVSKFVGGWILMIFLMFFDRE